MMLAAIAALVMSDPGPVEFKKWGVETIEAIRHDLYLPKQHLYREDNSGERVSYNWPSGVMLSALNAAARADARYKPWLKEYADAMKRYWHPEGGFDVLPLPKQADRYYDDNAWMAIALVETSRVLRDKSYLKLAKETVKFILSGEDPKLGGGIYWREQAKTSKNTCSNGPSALACVLTGSEYVSAGERIYRWTRERLEDSADHLYWDSISLNGRINRTKWSYNTALMIRAGRALARATGTREYGEAASLSAASAREHWLDPERGLIKDDMAFAHLLFEALLERGFPDAGKYLAGLHERCRDASGHYGKRWDDVASGTRKHFRLIDQASAARAFFLAALEPGHTSAGPRKS